jgi:hypothetical protein
MHFLVQKFLSLYECDQLFLTMTECANYGFGAEVSLSLHERDQLSLTMTNALTMDLVQKSL